MRLDQIVLSGGSFLVMDRAYIDYERLYQIHKAEAYFITRTKKNMNFERIYSAIKQKQIGSLT